MNDNTPASRKTSGGKEPPLLALARRLIRQGHRDRDVLVRRWQGVPPTDGEDEQTAAKLLELHPELVEPTIRFIESKLASKEQTTPDNENRKPHDN